MISLNFSLGQPLSLPMGNKFIDCVNYLQKLPN